MMLLSSTEAKYTSLVVEIDQMKNCASVKTEIIFHAHTCVLYSEYQNTTGAAPTPHCNGVV